MPQHCAHPTSQPLHSTAVHFSLFPLFPSVRPAPPFRLDLPRLGPCYDLGLDHKFPIRIGKQLALRLDPLNPNVLCISLPRLNQQAKPHTTTFALDAARNHGRFDNSALTRVTPRPHLIEARRAQACINMRFRWIPPADPVLVASGEDISAHSGSEFGLPLCIPLLSSGVTNTFTKPGGEVSFTIPFQRRLRRLRRRSREGERSSHQKQHGEEEGVGVLFKVQLDKSSYIVPPCSGLGVLEVD